MGVSAESLSPHRLLRLRLAAGAGREAGRSPDRQRCLGRCARQLGPPVLQSERITHPSTPGDCCAAFSPGTSERRCKCSAQKTKGSRGRRSPPQTLLHDNIRIYEQGPSAAHYTNPCLNLSGVSAGSASILSASGSCASCWEFIASTLGASYSAGDLIEPHGVVLIGETKSFSRPSRNLIFQEMLAFSSS